MSEHVNPTVIDESNEPDDPNNMEQQLLEEDLKKSLEGIELGPILGAAWA